MLQQMEAETGIKENKDTFVRDLINMIIYFLIVVALSILAVHFIGQRTQVSGRSMENTLYNSDNLIVDKLTYQFRDPVRYDIIVFPYPKDESVYFIKRIIGLPGEEVQIQGNTIYINGEPIQEEYGKEVMEANSEGIALEPILLGEDEYFVLGDNRNHSMDSRDPDVGMIKKDSILGKAWIRIWPLNRFGMLKHQ